MQRQTAALHDMMVPCRTDSEQGVPEPISKKTAYLLSLEDLSLFCHCRRHKTRFGGGIKILIIIKFSVNTASFAAEQALGSYKMPTLSNKTNLHGPFNLGKHL